VGSPSDEELDRLASGAADANPTYRDGAKAASYRQEEWSRELAPTTTWEVALATLDGWRMHGSAGVRVRPLDRPREGLTVALAIRLGPVAVLAPCRVTSVIDDDDEHGFVYASLPGHPEDGEEGFTLRRDPDGRISLTIKVVSRPAGLLARAGGPVTRSVQRAFTRRYLSFDGLAETPCGRYLTRQGARPGSLTSDWEGPFQGKGAGRENRDDSSPL
jgi:uncharacterized protein (UPF0548 family)